MVEHPAVVFLREAHTRAEEPARSATPGPWEVQRWDDDEVCTVLGSGDALVGYPVAYVRAEFAGCLRLDEDRTRANARLITSYADPAVLLRRVAAERQILAEHRLVKACGYDGYGAATFDACQICGRGGYTPGPCRTVLLAEAWGWTEEMPADR